MITSPLPAYAVKARYIFPVDSPPDQDGVVSIAEGRIVAVGENRFPQPPVDLGNVALLPGLVNAHTHLEFSHLESPLGAPAAPFADWIRAVIAYRRRREETSAAPRSRSIENGLQECLAAGTTTVGEIFCPPAETEPFIQSPLHTCVFLELLGLAESRVGPLMDLAVEFISAATKESQHHVWAGVSPHAPYTASPELVGQAARLSARSNAPLAMHLAETVEELELLQSSSGPLVELLQELNAWYGAAIPRGLWPMNYLQQLAGAARAIVVHGNYLVDDEIAFLAEHRRSMAAVYCPRTHAYFGHEAYPLIEMLDAGVCVGLGTDSRASNPNLNLFEEMRFVTKRYPALSPSLALEMGTLNGAEALGAKREIGSISPGKRADMALFSLPDRSAGDPHELLFDDVSTCAGVIIDGRLFIDP